MNASLAALINASFGFDPVESHHHFSVFIPTGCNGNVTVSEYLT